MASDIAVARYYVVVLRSTIALLLAVPVPLVYLALGEAEALRDAA